MRKIIYLTILLSIFVCHYRLFAADEIWRSPEAEREAIKRKDAISKETGNLPKSHWVGEYHMGDGKGINISLAIAPESGFVFEWYGCMGLYGRNYGAINYKDGKLILKPILKNKKGFGGISEEFYVINWGKRIYLVPPDEMIDFCNRINSKLEPINSPIGGSFLLKRGHEKYSVSGWPNWPQNVPFCLLEKTINGRITKINESNVLNSRCDSYLRSTTATINIGKINGAFIGMELFLADSYVRGKVIAVKEKTCAVKFEQHSEGSPIPEIGWRLSTQPKYPKQE